MKQYPVKTAALPNGETIAYRTAGEHGPVIVLIHGNMSSSVHWQTTMEQLEQDYRVYAPDLRGFGDSSYEAPFDSLRDLANDVAHWLDAIGLTESYTAVGWSTGGGVSMELAADRPNQVAKVILLDSVPLTGYPLFKKDTNGAPIHAKPHKTKEDLAADPVQVLPILTAYATNNRKYMRGIWNALIYNLREPSAEDYEAYLTAIMKQRNLVDVYYSLATFNMTNGPTGSADGSNRASLVNCPVVVLQGEKDLVVPFAWGQSIKNYFGDQATMITFPEAGHSVITDDPELFFTTLRAQLT